MKKNENNLRKVWKVQKTAVSLHCVRGDTNTTTKNFQKQKTQVS